MFDYLIVGAGFAGSVMAERLASQLNKKVLVIDQRTHIAGNCFDLKDGNNILIHQYGPHLFHTNNKKVWDYLSLFTEWDIYHHEVQAMIDGRKINIPFNFNSLEHTFPAELASKLVNKLLEFYPYNSKVPILELKKSDDTDLQFLADFVYEKIFVHYTAKQWDKKPEEMDSAVTARVPIFVGNDNRYFNDKYQALPKEGYTSIVQKMLNHPNIRLMLNTSFNDVASFDSENNIFTLFEQPFEGKVIYTGQIDELFNYKYGELPYRSIDMKFETVDKEYYQEVATVNYPNNYDYLRITEFKHMHPTKSDRTTILKEYPQPYIRGKNTPYYPIFTDECRNKYLQYVKDAEKMSNLLLVGRLAEYRYYDMDDMVERALEVFDKEV
jgi:UDP-galactopyranose mutase